MAPSDIPSAHTPAGAHVRNDADSLSLTQGLDGDPPTMLPAAQTRAEDCYVPFGLTLPTVAPRPTGRHSVSSALPCIAFQQVEERAGTFQRGRLRKPSFRRRKFSNGSTALFGVFRARRTRSKKPPRTGKPG